MKIVAVIPTHNEADIIYHCVRKLTEQDITVNVLDDHSTDDTVAEARRGGASVTQFRPKGWMDIVRGCRTWAMTSGAEWAIYQDADEIMRPRPAFAPSYRAAIEHVDALGFNVIDHEVAQFPPIDEGFTPGTDHETYFEWCRPPKGPAGIPTGLAEADDPVLWWPRRFTEPGVLVFERTWKIAEAPLEALLTNGHGIEEFSGKAVFPQRMVLKHYPFRSTAHGEGKVKMRFERLAPEFNHQYEAPRPFVEDIEGLARYPV